MKQRERQQRILDLLEERGSLRTEELAGLCDVSGSTIRRDLDRLQGEGKAVREHGLARRASAAVNEASEPVLRQKQAAPLEEKIRLAKRAAGLVKDGDLIWLDSGTTTAQLWPFLAGKDVTVVTNSVSVTAGVRSSDRARLILGPGVYSAEHGLVDGSDYLMFMSRYRYDLCFLSCNGLDEERGIFTCTSEDAANHKRQALICGDRICMLADRSKRSLHGPITFGWFRQADVILTTDETGQITDLARKPCAGS